MKDDVDHATKQRRLVEVIEVFREKVQQRNVNSEKGKLRVVLVEFDSRRSTKDVGESKEKAARRGTECGSGRTSDIVRSGRNVSGIVLCVFLLIVLRLIVFVRSGSFFLLLLQQHWGDRRVGVLSLPSYRSRGRGDNATIVALLPVRRRRSSALPGRRRGAHDADGSSE